jgi:hypothetical protein
MMILCKRTSIIYHLLPQELNKSLPRVLLIKFLFKTQKILLKVKRQNLKKLLKKSVIYLMNLCPSQEKWFRASTLWFLLLPERVRKTKRRTIAAFLLRSQSKQVQNKTFSMMIKDLKKRPTSKVEVSKKRQLRKHTLYL